MADTKNMSFTDLVDKLNEIESRDRQERRAKHDAQVEAAKAKKKQKSISETLKDAMKDKKLDEQVLGITEQPATDIITPDQFNNKAQKANIEISEESSADEKAVHDAFSNAQAMINRLEKMFRPGGKLDTAITSIGGESDAPAIQEALANAYDYLEDGHQNAMGHIHDK